MAITIKDLVSKLIPGVYLAEDKGLLLNEQLIGKHNAFER